MAVTITGLQHEPGAAYSTDLLSIIATTTCKVDFTLWFTFVMQVKCFGVLVFAADVCEHMVCFKLMHHLTDNFNIPQFLGI